jgi:hypothetical protein
LALRTLPCFNWCTGVGAHETLFSKSRMNLPHIDLIKEAPSWYMN